MRFLTIGKKEFNRELLNNAKLEVMFKKPKGCFWGSLYTPKKLYKSDWCRWVEQNMPDGYYTYGITYSLADTAKILTLENIDDFNKMLDRYGASENSNDLFVKKIVEISDSLGLSENIIDWLRIAEDYDAVHLTTEGARKLYFELYGWDCGSIAIFNSNIVENIEYIEWKDEV